MKPVRIDDVLVGRAYPARIVAEISNAHNGDEPRMARLIEQSVQAGADFVKFQAYTAEELVQLRGDGPAPEPWGSQGWTMHALYQKASTPREWLAGAFARVRSLGAVPFASAFGMESLDLLHALDCPAYKISALDCERWDFVEKVYWTASRGDASVIVSVRDASQAEKHRSLGADLILYCPPGYPQADIDWTALGWSDGLSYHGTNPGKVSAPCMVLSGWRASMVECHVELDAEPSELETEVCLNMSGLRLAIDNVRGFEKYHTSSA